MRRDDWGTARNVLLGVLLVAALLMLFMAVGTMDYHDRYDDLSDVDRAYLVSIGELSE